MLAECNLYTHHESLLAAGQKKPLPVVVVTGPLGAGKTTLVTHLLRHAHNLALVPAVHDMAPVNVDADLLERAARGPTLDLGDGCCCCDVTAQQRLRGSGATGERSGRGSAACPRRPRRGRRPADRSGCSALAAVARRPSRPAPAPSSATRCPCWTAAASTTLSSS